MVVHLPSETALDDLLLGLDLETDVQFPLVVPYEVQEGEVALGPPDGALLVVGQVEALLGDGVQEGSDDMVLVLWGAEDLYWVAVG